MRADAGNWKSSIGNVAGIACLLMVAPMAGCDDSSNAAEHLTSSPPMSVRAASTIAPAATANSSPRMDDAAVDTTASVATSGFALRTFEPSPDVALHGLKEVGVVVTLSGLADQWFDAARVEALLREQMAATGLKVLSKEEFSARAVPENIPLIVLAAEVTPEKHPGDVPITLVFFKVIEPVCIERRPDIKFPVNVWYTLSYGDSPRNLMLTHLGDSIERLVGQFKEELARQNSTN